MLTFRIEPDGNEFHAWCPELPGCHTHGRTPVEAMQNLKDAVHLYLEDVMDEEIVDRLGDGSGPAGDRDALLTP